jgi:hypothetical protein
VLAAARQACATAALFPCALAPLRRSPGKITMRTTVLLIALLLGACASDDVRADRECSRRGYQVGEPAYEACYQATMQRYQNGHMGLIRIGTGMLDR